MSEVMPVEQAVTDDALAPTSRTLTPAGVEIVYYSKPRRYYTVRDATKQHESEAIEVPSVTTILKVLDKPALPWWGMTVGAAAVQQLVSLGVVSIGYDGNSYGICRPQGGPFLGKYINEEGDERDELIDLVREYKLDTNHVVQEASDRGTGVHTALEVWGAIGQMPDPMSFPFRERGYVEALVKFLEDARGLKAIGMEIAVASIEHGYAGRFDLLAETTEEIDVITKVYKLGGKRPWKPKITTVPAGQRLLIDLKTSKDIYETHMIQLEAYEQGMIECGYGATDARAVLHVKADGRYEFRRSHATLDQFLAIKNASSAMAEVKESMKL